MRDCRSERVLSRRELVAAVDPRFMVRDTMGQAVRDVSQAVDAQREQIVQDVLLDYVRLTARQSVGVKIDRPTWMPVWLFRWLLRHVVVLETPLVMETAAPR